MVKRIGLSFLLTGALVSGCSWSAFDELSDETWVDAVGGADGVSPNQFLGIATPGVSSQNAVFVALGRATDSVGSYSYDGDGARATVGVDIRGGDNEGGGTEFGPLPADIPIAGDPYSNMVGVVSITGQAREGDTKVASFAADDIGQIASQNDFQAPGGAGGPLDGPIQATGMVYARTDDDLVDLTATDIVLARGAQIAMVSDYDGPDDTLSGCYGASDNDVVMNVARGAFDPSDDDDELVAVINDESGTAPQIVIFNGSSILAAWNGNGLALGGCFIDGELTRTPIARINGPAGIADFGSEIAVGDFDGDGDLDIVVSAPLSNEVRAYINAGNSVDFTELMVGAPFEASSFGAALAAGDLNDDGNDELVIGAPRSNVDGATNAGATTIYSFDGTSFGVEISVHDAEPEAEQRMGTSVAIVPWTAGDRQILVVGGDKEIFTYFRTTFYDDDVRNGQ